jgi:Protein of unknown function (DUF2809)
MKDSERKVSFNRQYAYLAIILFMIEVFIALFIRDKFVRPYFGDVLVVILIYCSVRSIFEVKVFPLAVSVLIFSFIIEYLQYLDIVEKLGWDNSIIARTLIGNSFAWKDIIAYTAGIFIVLLAESPRANKKNVWT